MDTICDKVVGSIAQTQTLLARTISSYCAQQGTSLHNFSASFRREFPDDGMLSLIATVETPALLSARRYQQLTGWIDSNYVVSGKRMHNPVYPLIRAHMETAPESEQMDYLSLACPEDGHGISFLDEVALRHHFVENHGSEIKLRLGLYLWKVMSTEIDRTVYQLARKCYSSVKPLEWPKSVHSASGSSILPVA